MKPQIKDTLKKGDECKFKNQSDQLIYIGENWSGNGYWHQFVKPENPDTVWCEIRDTELHLIEKTKGVE